MKLTLLRPLAFMDIESTGTNKETDKIIEISICKIHVDGTREIKTKRVNPGMPIPAESTAVHHITNEDVENEPMFANIAKSLFAFLEGCDVCGFGSNFFDVPLLHNEFKRCGLIWDHTKFHMIDAGNIFKIKEARTLGAALKFYCDRDIVDAHNAESDTMATVDVFTAQLDKYELPATVAELAFFSNYSKPILDLSGKFTTNEAGEIIFAFGPNRGLVAKEHCDFLEWMVYRADFPSDTNAIALKLLSEAYNQ